ncbi:MAG: 16S rRNA (cytosine967-C5)-methyltransferase, partial [Gammaproteobacteria bacterium]
MRETLLVPNLNNNNPRWLALQIILQVLQRGRSLDDILNSDWYQKHDIEKRDLAFARELAYGFCRWQSILTEQLSKQMKKPLRDKDQDVEVILLIGLYQLLVLKTDPHAAVNETVKLVKYLKKSWARGLVNGILRQLIRDQVTIENECLVNSYPDWILQRVRQDWGPEAESILIAGNLRAPMTLRINLSKKSVPEYLAELSDVGLEA